MDEEIRRISPEERIAMAEDTSVIGAGLGIAGRFMFNPSYLIGDGMYKHWNKSYGSNIVQQASEMAQYGISNKLVGSHNFLGSGMVSKGLEKINKGWATKTGTSSFGGINFNWIGSKTKMAEMIGVDEALGKTGFGISFGKNPTGAMQKGYNIGNEIARKVKTATSEVMKKVVPGASSVSNSAKATAEVMMNASKTAFNPATSKTIYGGMVNGTAKDVAYKVYGAGNKEAVKQAFVKKTAGTVANEASETAFGKVLNSNFMKSGIGINTSPFKNPLFLATMATTIAGDINTEVQASKTQMSHENQEISQYRMNNRGMSAFYNSAKQNQETDEYMYMLNRSSTSRRILNKMGARQY